MLSSVYDDLTVTFGDNKTASLRLFSVWRTFHRSLTFASTLCKVHAKPLGCLTLAWKFWLWFSLFIAVIHSEKRAFSQCTSWEFSISFHFHFLLNKSQKKWVSWPRQRVNVPKIMSCDLYCVFLGISMLKCAQQGSCSRNLHSGVWPAGTVKVGGKINICRFQNDLDLPRRSPPLCLRYMEQPGSQTCPHTAPICATLTEDNLVQTKGSYASF